ncbi:hypothetical protein [Pelagibaculum spongiae]|uniref:UrcA family protein n=1 Tax=Pelagibaculum spongiae TaxID=2080658 RepID=A0A2V1H1C7_9GAMM|nr:hypothetical protein [Pelagibaculum spongiae]PVZ69480.1 hypothetical protein DC094_09115 [Pelagibaculum spongiae]
MKFRLMRWLALWPLIIMSGSVAAAPANYDALPGIAYLSTFKAPPKDFCELRDWYAKAQWSLRRAHKVRVQACISKHMFIRSAGKKHCKQLVSDDYQFARQMLDQRCVIGEENQ